MSGSIASRSPYGERDVSLYNYLTNLIKFALRYSAKYPRALVMES